MNDGLLSTVAQVWVSVDCHMRLDRSRSRRRWRRRVWMERF